MKSGKMVALIAVAFIVVLAGFGAFIYTQSQDGPQITNIVFEAQDVRFGTNATTPAYFTATIEQGLGSGAYFLCSGGPSASIYSDGIYLGEIRAVEKTYKIDNGFRTLMYFDLKTVFEPFKYGDSLKLLSTGEKVKMSSLHYVIDPTTLPESWTKCMSKNCGLISI